jgi:Fic family protein
MKKNAQLDRSIVAYLEIHPGGVSTRELRESFEEYEVSPATLKRYIAELVAKGYVISKGLGKATRYELSAAYAVLHEVDAESYFAREIDERKARESFNHRLIKDTLNKFSLFTPAELDFLQEQQTFFTEKTASLSQHEYNAAMEHLAIDLSWKSSQIEGNTYSLLETERLLKHKETAAGKTKDEAVMLLNHKEAIDFIVSDPEYIKPLRVSAIEDIHSILVKELGVDRNLRKRSVGISGTNYRPIDNEFQIREAMEEMCALVNLKENAFEKALLLLLLISYIQPFNDGNKRTARIISNAILLNEKHCPLSFRTVDSLGYKKAMLIFYEQNNISAFKKIFLEQYEFAVKTYF